MADDVTGAIPPHLKHEVTLPAGTVIDGAVVELQQHPDGLVTADVRIPGHAGEWTFHECHKVGIRDIVLDPAYTPPWPGAGIKAADDHG